MALKRTITFLAFMDNGETAEVTYESEYVKEGFYINEMKKVMYKNVDVTDLLIYENAEDMPLGLWHAMENNAKSLWNEQLVDEY